jgi:uncharacterized iron-regulated membrane protein
MHRAGGLWPWALLLVIAWSGVAFNLKEVYQPVMGSLFAHQLSEDAYPPLAEPQLRPGLDWRAARVVARRLMDQQAAQLGFSIEGEDALMYIPDRALYVYDVKSSLDVARVSGVTRLFFDANSGELRGRWMPTGAAAGDTIRSWITLLHRAAIGGVFGGVPIKTLISMIGISTMALSITGILIWIRKKRARS